MTANWPQNSFYTQLIVSNFFLQVTITKHSETLIVPLYCVNEARLADLLLCSCPVSWAARGVAKVARSNILRALPRGLLLGHSPLVSYKPIVCR